MAYVLLAALWLHRDARADTPPLNLPDLSGAMLDIAQHRGELVIINFWASWCRPCLEEMPSLQRLDAYMHDRPLKILAVNYRESKSTVRRFRKLLDMQFTLLLDQAGDTSRAWRVDIFPTSFLVDAEGDIRAVLKGAVEWDSGEILEQIEALMPDRVTRSTATLTQRRP